jgi:carbonic anhydrase
MHFVHRDLSDASKLGVVAVFFDAKEGGNIRNDFIESMQIDNLDDNTLIEG